MGGGVGHVTTVGIVRTQSQSKLAYWSTIDTQNRSSEGQVKTRFKRIMGQDIQYKTDMRANQVLSKSINNGLYRSQI